MGRGGEALLYCNAFASALSFIFFAFHRVFADSCADLRFLSRKLRSLSNFFEIIRDGFPKIGVHISAN